MGAARRVGVQGRGSASTGTGGRGALTRSIPTDITPISRSRAGAEQSSGPTRLWALDIRGYHADIRESRSQRLAANATGCDTDGYPADSQRDGCRRRGPLTPPTATDRPVSIDTRGYRADSQGMRPPTGPHHPPTATDPISLDISPISRRRDRRTGAAGPAASLVRGGERRSRSRRYGRSRLSLRWTLGARRWALGARRPRLGGPRRRGRRRRRGWRGWRDPCGCRDRRGRRGSPAASRPCPRRRPRPPPGSIRR